MIDAVLIVILVLVAFAVPAWIICRDLDADDSLDNRF